MWVSFSLSYRLWVSGFGNFICYYLTVFLFMGANMTEKTDTYVVNNSFCSIFRRELLLLVLIVVAISRKCLCVRVGSVTHCFLWIRAPCLVSEFRTQLVLFFLCPKCWHLIYTESLSCWRILFCIANYFLPMGILIGGFTSYESS